MECGYSLPPLDNPGVFGGGDELTKRDGGHLGDQPNHQVNISRYMVNSDETGGESYLKSVTDIPWNGIHHNL